jgi:hypothetical protein
MSGSKGKPRAKRKGRDLGELIKDAATGQEVVIMSSGSPAVRLLLVRPSKQEDQGDYEPPKSIGHALDRFIGTWSADQEAEVLKAVEVFEQVDPSFWQ